MELVRLVNSSFHKLFLQHLDTMRLQVHWKLFHSNWQAFYAGGSDSSGQQILGPSRENKNSKDFVSNIFKSAKESGAEVVENSSHPNRPSGSRGFLGAGYRLGQTNDDHVLMADTSSSRSSTESMDPIILRLWRQGFTINDSELRLYEDQKNREFLEYITKG